MSEERPTVPEVHTTASMVWIEGSEFAMGSDDFYPDEGPVRRVAVPGFWIDPYPVTNAELAAFVDGYVHRAASDRQRVPRVCPEGFGSRHFVSFRVVSGPRVDAVWTQGFR